MVVMVPTIGRIKALVAPTSAPPLAVTRASSPPDEESANPAFIDVFFCLMAESHISTMLSVHYTTLTGIMISGWIGGVLTSSLGVKTNISIV